MLTRIPNIGTYLGLQDGRTPLHWASTSPGGVEIVQFLLEQKGIEVDKPDGSGWTPLHIAGMHAVRC